MQILQHICIAQFKKYVLISLRIFRSLTRFMFVIVLEMSRQIQICSTNRRDLPNPTPFPFVVRVDKVSDSQLRDRVLYCTPCFF
jgi:DNA phosphorothioation-dependent restriction protein DptG